MDARTGIPRSHTRLRAVVPRVYVRPETKLSHRMFLAETKLSRRRCGTVWWRATGNLDHETEAAMKPTCRCQRVRYES